MKEKIALFCSVSKDAVVEALDESSIYNVPVSLFSQGVDSFVLEKLRIPLEVEPDISDWRKVVKGFCEPSRETEIAIVGKYMDNKDAYLSVVEALYHAGISERARVRIRFVEAENIEERGAENLLKGVDGVLIPGGFGSRGFEGKIMAARYAREEKIPYLGLCLGMQVAVVEFARNVCGLSGSNSTEMDPGTPNPVIHLMEDQEKIDTMGGTMRLGSYNCRLESNTRARDLYNTEKVRERHRHRYEFNNLYLERFEEAGMIFSGINPELGLVEIIELKEHPWFIGVQFHPEFRSRPVRPHPLFGGFVKAALERDHPIP
jgi:CTP synthase